jgi:hypothetical protein
MGDGQLVVPRWQCHHSINEVVGRLRRLRFGRCDSVRRCSFTHVARRLSKLPFTIGVFEDIQPRHYVAVGSIRS